MSDADLQRALLDAQRGEPLARFVRQIERAGIDPVALALELLRTPGDPARVRVLELSDAARHNVVHVRRDDGDMLCGAVSIEPCERYPEGVGLTHAAASRATCVRCLQAAQRNDDPFRQLLTIRELEARIAGTIPGDPGYERTCEHTQGHLRLCTRPVPGNVGLLCAGHAAAAAGSRDPALMCLVCHHAWIDHDGESGCLSGWGIESSDPQPPGCGCMRIRNGV